jgi:PAT family beta-lactamase induction signal transducer AmpG
VTYLASGFPLGLIRGVPSAYLTDRAVPQTLLGLLAWLEAPYVLKFAWAPLVDRFGTRRTWIVAALTVLAVGTAIIPWLPVAGSIPATLAVLLFVLATASATQDIAIDARAVDAFPPALVGHVSAVRVNAARVGYLLAGSALVALAGPWPWRRVFPIAAGLLALLAVAATRLPAAPRRPVERESFVAPLRRLLARPGFAAVAAFLFLFKLGDNALAEMTTPFLKAATSAGGAGWGNDTLGVARFAGIGASIVGAALGGWFTMRRGIVAGIVVLGALQAGSNLVYAAAALTPTAAWTWSAVLVEPFCGGLGMAPYGALMLRSCSTTTPGADFAALTTFMALSRLAAGSLSGFGAEAMGRPVYFAVTAAIALPAFLFLPAVRRWLAAA